MEIFKTGSIEIPASSLEIELLIKCRKISQFEGISDTICDLAVNFASSNSPWS